MEKYKINSSALRSMIGENLLLVNNFYPIIVSEGNTKYTEVPERSESILVTVQSVELDKTSNFIKVVCKSVDDGKLRTLSLRRNGVSFNFNEKGKYEHYFEYDKLTYSVVRTYTKVDGLDEECMSEYVIPTSLKRGLPNGVGKVNREVTRILVSTDKFESPADAVKDPCEFFEEIYNVNKPTN